jgi:hypothetical protein
MSISSLKLKTIAAILFVAAAATHAQTPDPPSQVAPDPLSVWPQPGVLPAPVQIVTFDGVSSVCPHRKIEPDRITCGAARNQPAQVFDRKYVQSIAVAPKDRRDVDGLERVALYGGLTSILLGGACGVDGGPVCKTPEIVGLSLLATGVVIHIVKRHSRNRPLRLIYVGHLPPADIRQPDTS